MTSPSPQTIERQARASDPARSAWVSANAGSGKTYVLVQRVVRLLLAGADPAFRSRRRSVDFVRDRPGPAGRSPRGRAGEPVSVP